MQALFNISVEGRSFQKWYEIEFTPAVGMPVFTNSTRTIIDLVSLDLDDDPGWWYIVLRLNPITPVNLFLQHYQEEGWEEEER